MKLSVVLEPDIDGGFVASIPALPGCNSQGDNREEAMANIREAAEAYIEYYRRRGEQVPVGGEDCGMYGHFG